MNRHVPAAENTELYKTKYIPSQSLLSLRELDNKLHQYKCHKDFKNKETELRLRCGGAVLTVSKGLLKDMITHVQMCVNEKKETLRPEQVRFRQQREPVCLSQER